MAVHAGDHDRAAAAPDRAPTPVDPPVDPLGDALARLTLQGAIFLRGEYTEPWEYESVPGADAAAILSPGRRRVILFHVVASGRAWVEVGDGERHWGNAGDVFVLPYGDTHRMGGSDASLSCTAFGTVLPRPPWREMPVVRLGGGGQATDIVCGYLACDDPLFEPRMQALPPVFVVSPPPGPARDWVRAGVEFALQQTALVTDSQVEAPTRLPELLLLEVLRLHLASAPAADHGWIRAMRDPVLAPALAAIHAAPGQKWSVGLLAREARVSDSLLDERFREVLGLAPIRYLAGWRMHLAEDLLRSSDLPVVAVARRVGYDSEEAFSRAFKRAHGQPPSSWRVQRPR